MKEEMQSFFRKKIKTISKFTNEEKIESLVVLRKNFIREIDRRILVLRKAKHLIAEALRQKKDLRQYRESIWNFVTHIHVRHLISIPFIYVMFIPAIIFHLFIEVYHQTCFRLYRIPMVKSNDFFVYDRGHLSYLNIIEKINCWYCSYINGLMSYGVEIAGKTEKYWCPIKHARRRTNPHNHYDDFFEYLDGEKYRERISSNRDLKK